jgi:hypothetical protein
MDLNWNSGTLRMDPDLQTRIQNTFNRLIKNIVYCTVPYHTVRDESDNFFYSVHPTKSNKIPTVWISLRNNLCWLQAYRVPNPSHLPLRAAKTGKNHCWTRKLPHHPTGIGERFRQTISNLGHAALLRWCELPESPYKRKYCTKN